MKNLLSCSDSIITDPRTLPLLQESLKLSKGIYESGVKFMEQALVGMLSDPTSKSLVDSAGRYATNTIRKFQEHARKLSKTVDDYQKQGNLENSLKGVLAAAQILTGSYSTLGPALAIEGNYFFIFLSFF